MLFACRLYGCSLDCFIEQFRKYLLFPLLRVPKFPMVLCRRASVNRPPTPRAEEDGEKEPSLREIINVKVLLIFPILRESNNEILGPFCFSLLAIYDPVAQRWSFLASGVWSKRVGLVRFS